MMKQPFMDEDEEMNSNGDTTGRSLLRENDTKKEGEEGGFPYCSCLSVGYYKSYFDVDTVDVLNRLRSCTVYCGQDDQFVNMIDEKPDLYGPFWITTSLVFSVAVSSHISNWLSSWMTGENWQYDFQSIVTASSLLYGYMGIVPFLVYIGLKQFGGELKLLTLICLYGYSLGVFLPASILCLVPSPTIIWIALMTAAASSAILLIRNILPSLPSASQSHSQTVMGVVGVIQVILCLALKLCIY